MDAQDRVLLVDDGLELVMFLKLILKFQFSFHVFPTIDAGSAINMLHEGIFEMVITDYSMPGMNGMNLLERVGEIQPQAVKVLISGLQPDERIEQALKNGIVDLFLPKPLKMNSMLTLLRPLLDKSALSKTNPKTAA